MTPLVTMSEGQEDKTQKRKGFITFHLTAAMFSALFSQNCCYLTAVYYFFFCTKTQILRYFVFCTAAMITCYKRCFFPTVNLYSLYIYSVLCFQVPVDILSYLCITTIKNSQFLNFVHPKEQLSLYLSYLSI